MSNDTDTAESKKDSAGTADSVGIEEAGFESHNNSREETQAIMEASSPDDVDKDLLERIEEERKERLDPDNRPEHAEVDNTQRTFIAEEARFEDSEVDADDGIGQKEPDPETQASSSDDPTSADNEAPQDTDGDTEAEQEAAQSDASTGPEPTAADDSSSGSAGGKHKA